jgi:hypothetical protein
MLALLKKLVLIKEAIKLAFFRLVEYLKHQPFVGSITGSRVRNRGLSLKLISL